MKANKRSFNNISLFIFLLLINIPQAFQTFLSFNYPYAFTIKDRNIFVIHQNGVTICDPTFKSIIREEITFQESEKIKSDASLSKVASLYENGYIICLINDYIYIFDEEGNFKYKSTSSIHMGSVYGEYYTLVNKGLIDNYLYYIIGFVYNSKLYFYCYKYSISANTNTNYANLNNYNHRYTDSYSYSIKNKGLSCQYVIKSSVGQALLCIFLISDSSSYKLAFEYFEVTKTTITQVSNSYYNQYLSYSTYNVLCIKTSISLDKTKVLVSTYNFNEIGTFFSFDVNYYYSSSSEFVFKYIIKHYFKKVYHSLKFTYFSETNEFLMTGILTDNDRDGDGYSENDLVLAEFFDSEHNNYNYAWKYERSCDIKAYSIVYLQHKSAYYIISDIDCSGTKYPIQILMGVEPTTELVDVTTQYIENIQTTQYIENIPTTQYIENIPTTNIENIPTTQNIENIPTTQNIEYNPTTQFKETERIIDTCENLEKCELCNEESLNKNLCIKCNNLKGYYFLNINSISREEIGDSYIDCVNEETKPSKFYFNEENEDYRLCYDTCATCESGGNWEINNCKTCEQNFRFKPDINPTTNCVMKCPSYYYFTNNDQYKCTEDFYCPLDYILLIKEKGKCTNDCKKDDTYQYQYDNKCLKECPDNTVLDNYICKDKNTNSSYNTETNHTFFDGNITEEKLAMLAQYYKENFYYTNNHISTYKSNNFTIAIYKNSESISNLSLDIPKLNFENCYTKIKNELHINDDLIILVESEKIENGNDKIISFSVYDPRNGEKIIFNELCKNESVLVEEELQSKVTNLDQFIYLTNQGIDLLNPNSDFYTDFCFHFKSPIDGKDLPLKERFKLFFPNVPLCEKGCFNKGINATTNTSICECTLNDLINNDIFGENIFFQSAMAEIKTLFQETNIEVLRCYKDLFHIEFYTSNYGSFIILGLLIIQIVLTIIYYKKFIFSMRKYLYDLMVTFLDYLSIKRNSNTKINNYMIPRKTDVIKLKANPIKKSSKNINQNINNESVNNIVDNKTIKIEPRNKNGIRNSDDLGKVSSNRNLNPNSKNRNSLIIGKLLNINVKEYIKTAPDDMDYDNAIRRDHRTFGAYFADNIKTDILILNIFCNYEQLNPWPIKCLLFILNIDLYFFVNGLFFTEDYLSEMLYDKNVNFIDFASRFIDRLYYITLIGIITSYIMNCFFFEERIIKKIFKREKNNQLILKYEMSQLIKNIKNRYNSFIIICFCAAIFIWYYAFCFNNIYPSMKKEWIITSIIIVFAMEFVYFLKLLLETIIRFIAIKCKSERLFKISQFLS